jgi:hypothetical protein
MPSCRVCEVAGRWYKLGGHVSGSQTIELAFHTSCSDTPMPRDSLLDPGWRRPRSYRNDAHRVSGGCRQTGGRDTPRPQPPCLGWLEVWIDEQLPSEHKAPNSCLGPIFAEHDRTSCFEHVVSFVPIREPLGSRARRRAWLVEMSWPIVSV